MVYILVLLNFRILFSVQKNLQDVNMNGKVILKWMDWIHLAKDRDQQRALLTMVMNLWVS
jgi:hypothetical protein